MTEEEILNSLDHSNDGYYCSFVSLGHGYSYLIDTRLTIFSADNNRWAIAVERLGYNPREGTIALEIYYYGNCLINLEYYNERPTSSYSIYPIDADNYEETTDGENLKPEAKFWLVRGQKISLSHNKQDYADAGIGLKEYDSNAIRVEEVGRLVVSKNNKTFLATDKELYKSIPPDLKKIMVLDEWFHKDFELQISSPMPEEHIRRTFELNKNLTGLDGLTFEHFAQLLKQQAIVSDDCNREIWENNRPSSYETWQLIAKVIITNDATKYQPILKANTHWANWPDSGSL